MVFSKSASKILNYYQTPNLLFQKSAKEDEIWKEIARDDTEMGCDGGDFRNE